MSAFSRNKTLLSAACLGWGLAGCSGSDPYQGLDADALFRTAESEFEEGSYENSIDALERLRVSFGDWNRIADARLLQADAHFENGDYLTARSEYRRFLDRFVGDRRSATAALGECRSLAALAPHPQRDQGYTEEAITICGNVVIDYSGTPEADEAGGIRTALRFTMAEKEYLTASHYFRRKQFDPAIIYFQFVIDLYPDTEFAPRALLGIYRANTEIGYDDLATEARRQLLIEYPDSDEASEIEATGPQS